MKRKNSSLIDLFQDPLLTLVALVLINMAWVVLSDVNPPEIRGAAPNDRRRLTAIVDSLEHRLQRLIERESQLPPEPTENLSTRNSLAELRLRVAELNAEIYRLSREKDSIESQNITTGGTISEAESHARVKELRRQLEVKRQELRQREDELARVRERSARELTEAEKERAQLERQVLDAQEKTDLLSKQLDDKRSTQAVAGQYRATPMSISQKEPNFVEVGSGRVFVVWFDEISSEAYSSESIGLGVRLTRKSEAKGDDEASLQNDNSSFRQALKKLDPQTDSVIFLVHSDSIGLYRKARGVAERAGYDTGWYPHDRDFLAFGPGGRTPGVEQRAPGGSD